MVPCPSILVARLTAAPAARCIPPHSFGFKLKARRRGARRHAYDAYALIEGTCFSSQRGTVGVTRPVTTHAYFQVRYTTMHSCTWSPSTGEKGQRAEGPRSRGVGGWPQIASVIVFARFPHVVFQNDHLYCTNHLGRFARRQIHSTA